MNNDEKARFLDALASNPYIGICIIDKNGTTVLRASINEELSGIKNSEVIGKHYSVMPHYKELMEVLERGVPKLGLTYKTVSGGHAVIHRIPLKIDDEIIGAISITSIKDIREMQTLFDKYYLLKNKLKYYDKGLRRLRSAKYTFKSIIGVSSSAVTNKNLARNFAKGRSPVLISGETGTGKE
ncbi:MAG: hypothetical protein JJV98_17350, partial [Desulfosarcina sp.]|nr:hypothetical protein [Desulfobacterales bacterium]